jgi:D-proline reductase (dithiol) PrdB
MDGMDVMDLAAFRARYPEWIAQARPWLQQKRWREGFAAFPYPVNPAAPWTPMVKPLAECRLALFSTAGLYIPGEQAAFDLADEEGDPSFRELPRGVDPARLAIAHDHYDHASARLDPDSVFPLRRLVELERHGVIGELTPILYSTSGYVPALHRVVEETAPAIVASLKAQAADAVLHVPV